MSGLDAAAGVVGILGVAQQLTSSVIKIKQFCLNVKNAPDELLDTIQTLEHFSTMLKRLGEHQELRSNPLRNVDILEGSLHICAKAVDRISALALFLQPAKANEKHWQAVKIVLKQKEVDRMLSKLDRSKADLQLAYTMYTDACRQEEYRSIKHYIAEERHFLLQNLVSASASVPVSDSGQRDAVCDENGIQADSHLARSQPSHHIDQTAAIRIHLPTWICRHAWDVAYSRGCGQWKFSFKHINIITGDHPFIRLVETDDTDGVRRLLEARQLSVHDEIGHYYPVSIINRAINYGSINIVKLLLESGASLDQYSHHRLFSALTRTAVSGKTLLFISRSFEVIREMAQLVLSNIPDEASKFYESMAKSPSLWTDSERLRLMAFDNKFTGHEVERTSLYVLHDHTIRETVDFSSPFEYYQGMNVLHFLAERFHIIYADSWCRHMWSKAVERHATLPDLLYGKQEYCCPVWSTGQYTPFEMLLRGMCHPTLWMGTATARQDALRLWIRCIADAGVPLEEYGKREYHRKSWTFHQRYRSSGFVSLTTGSRPEEWHIWWVHPGDLYAGIFWECIEHPHQLVPGAWVEEEQTIPEYDRWRRGWHGRRIGIKRRTLRRLRARLKCPETSFEERQMIEDLDKCVSQNAEDWRDVGRGRGYGPNMLRLATFLGITTPEFRRWY